jgi:hypothetical protein
MIQESAKSELTFENLMPIQTEAIKFVKRYNSVLSSAVNMDDLISNNGCNSVNNEGV